MEYSDNATLVPMVRYRRVVPGAYRVYEGEVFVAKTCVTCMVLLPVSEFSEKRVANDGLCPKCKPCTAKYRQDTWEARRACEAAYYEANKVKINENGRRYYRDNIDRIRAHKASYREQNRSRVNAARREHYRNNSDMYRLSLERYTEGLRNRTDAEIALDREARNPDGVKVCSACHVGREMSEFSRNRTKPDGLNRRCKVCDRLSATRRKERVYLNYWESQSIPIECYICGGPFEDIEHVWCLSAKGPDVPENTLPVCVSCNRGRGGKWDKPLVQWLTTTRPHLLDDVLSRVLVDYQVWPWPDSQTVTITPETATSGRVVLREPTDRPGVDVTARVMGW